VFHSHFSKIVKIQEKIGLDNPTAQDIAQIAFFNLVTRDIPPNTEGLTLEQQLIHLLNRKQFQARIDSHRTEGKRAERCQPLDDKLVHTEQVNPEAIRIEKEDQEERLLLQEKILGIMQTRLKPIYSEAIKLAYLKGLPYKEAATQIGISEEAFKSRVARGIIQLRSILAKEK
jgi:RNA polymerase sigma factor (sigma-70 family)